MPEQMCQPGSRIPNRKTFAAFRVDSLPQIVCGKKNDFADHSRKTFGRGSAHVGRMARRCQAALSPAQGRMGSEGGFL
jgi:hypothetical protein